MVRGNGSAITYMNIRGIVERSKFVWHYQNNPFYQGILHVSVLHKQTSFPFAAKL